VIKETGGCCAKACARIAGIKSAVCDAAMPERNEKRYFKENIL